MTEAATREERIGTTLDCLRCDRRELPDGYVETRRTPTFDAESVPAGLRRTHTTRTGIWAKIRVEAGALHYRVHAPFHSEEVLVPGRTGIVLPEVEHEVAPDGEVRFFVAFYGPSGD